MIYELDILRRADATATPYHQRFCYETDDAAATVATVLTALNGDEDLRDADGAPAAPIRWECSCMQKKCGACAMVIDGKPGLACDARLAEHGATITLAPLTKFPVVADLLVDRTAMRNALKDAALWFTGGAVFPKKGNDLPYDAARCLQCGCCLEVCPNYGGDDGFGGAALAVPFTRLLTEAPRLQRPAVYKAYDRKVFAGCGKSLACRRICPAAIDIDRLLSAASPWNLRQRLLRR